MAIMADFRKKGRHRMSTPQTDATEALEVGNIFDAVHLLSNGGFTVEFINECKKRNLNVYISPELRALAEDYMRKVPRHVLSMHVFLATGCCGR